MNRFTREIMYSVVVLVGEIVVYGKSSLITIMFRWLCIDAVSYTHLTLPTKA